MVKNHPENLAGLAAVVGFADGSLKLAHELCHHYYKDHSAAFFNLLTSKIPNWKHIEDKKEQKILGI